MIEGGLLVGLLVIAVLGTVASCGWDVYEMRNRENWLWTALIGLLVLTMPNHWLAAVLAVFGLGLWQIGRSWFLLRSLVMPTVALAACYAVLAPLAQPWMVAPVLWAMASIGALLGGWTIFSRWHGIPYTYATTKTWAGQWGIYEHLPLPANYMSGQGNTMHLLSMASLSVAAAIGLLVMGQWAALGLLPWCASTIALCQINKQADSVAGRHWHPNQGVLHLLVLGLGGVFLAWPWIGLTSAAVGGLAVLAVTQPWKVDHWGWWDSGRIAYWKDMLAYVWWPQGWRCRLFGFGTGTWFVATVGMGHLRKHQNVMTAAHNEFVQQLLEHGVVGLVALCAYLGEALWRTAQGGADGQAVFLVGLVACSVAMVNFPWTFYHEWHPANTKEECWFGSPSLNAWSFVLAILAEAF